MRRVPDTAVYLHLAEDAAPLALRANVEHNHVLHEHVVIISAQTANAPHIPWEQRPTVDHLGAPRDGIVHIAANYIPDALCGASAESLGGDIDPDSASYLLSRITLRRTHQPGMSTWRKQLFVALAHNAANQTDYLCLPDAPTIITIIIIISSHVDI